MIVALACVILAVWGLFSPVPDNKHRSGVNIVGLFPALLIFVALIAAVVDRMVRKRITELNKIWKVESLILLPILLFFMLQFF